MTIYTVHEVSMAGTPFTSQSPGGTTGDSFPNTGFEEVWIKYAGAGDPTVDFKTADTCNYGLTHTETRHVNVGGVKEWKFGPFPKAKWGDSITVEYSATTSITLDVLRFTGQK